MKKIKKNEKTKKKIEILFGRPNSSTVFKFSRKIKSFSENHKMAARVSSMFISPSNYPQENKYWRPAGNYLCTIFVSRPSLSKQQKIVKRPRQLLYLHHSAVRQDLNALLNHDHFNFLCILFSFMYLCYNTLSSKPFV